MASGTDVDNALADALSAVLYPAGSDRSAASPIIGMPAKIERGWPVSAVLNADLAAGVATISVYPRPGLTRNSTRWLNTILLRSATYPGIGVTPSTLTIRAGDSAQVTFLGTAIAGDAIGMVVSEAGQQSAVTADFVVGADGAAAAEAFAAALASTAPALPMTASANAGTITLTSTATKTLTVSVQTGNGGTQMREIGRRQREMQVIVWTSTSEMRDAVGPVVEQALAAMEADYGLALPDSTYGRVMCGGDADIDEGGLAGNYRRDFLLSVDYAITTQDALYALLAPVINASGSYATERFVLDGEGNPVLDGDNDPVLTASF